MPYEELWVESYQGEVIGEVVFGTLAELQGDEDRKAQLEVLTILERTTKELADPVFERQGFDRGDLAEVVSVAAELAEGSAALSWEEFLGSVEAVATQFLGKYRELVDLAPDEFEREIAEAYVLHEEALLTFTRRALGHDEGDPLEAVLAVPHLSRAASA